MMMTMVTSIMVKNKNLAQQKQNGFFFLFFQNIMWELELTCLKFSA